MKKILTIFTALTILCSQNLLFARDVYVDNVAIVLDGSGSMNTTMNEGNITRMDAAKAAIKEVMKTIPESTHIGLIAFSERANGWLFKLGSRNDPELFAELDQISPSGGTPLGGYMKIAADALLEAQRNQYGYGSYRLLIVTDGEASDPQKVTSYTPDIMSRGIIVDVIGVDMKTDHALATRATSYRRANDPASLKAAIEEVFAEVNADDSGDTQDNTFEELAAIPPELLLTIIHTMSTSGNEPIGSYRLAGVQNTEQTSAPTQKNPKASSQKSEKGFNWIWVLIAIAIIWKMVFKSKKK